jgi:NADPH:quinone reductase-like Zn-dependent oxidoreductase
MRATMRAVVVPQTGGPEVLELRDVPAPSPGEGEVSIDVAHAGVNYSEVMARRGDFHVDLPLVPGLEVSGHIAAVGPGVTEFEAGQAVAALTLVGGYAEVAVARVPMVVPVPDAVDLRAAAGFPTIAPTAYALLVDVARLRQGEIVLVHAAAGGMGTVLGQIARYLGAGRVIGTVGSADKISYARRFGYDLVIERAGFADAVRRETGGRGVDVVLDSVGGAVPTVRAVRRRRTGQSRLLSDFRRLRPGYPSVRRHHSPTRTDCPIRARLATTPACPRTTSRRQRRHSIPDRREVASPGGRPPLARRRHRGVHSWVLD